MDKNVQAKNLSPGLKAKKWQGLNFEFFCPKIFFRFVILDLPGCVRLVLKRTLFSEIRFSPVKIRFLAFRKLIRKSSDLMAQLFSEKFFGIFDHFFAFYRCKSAIWRLFGNFFDFILYFFASSHFLYRFWLGLWRFCFFAPSKDAVFLTFIF